MKVKDLIEKLKEMPQEATVTTEACNRYFVNGLSGFVDKVIGVSSENYYQGGNKVSRTLGITTDFSHQWSYKPNHDQINSKDLHETIVIIHA